VASRATFRSPRSYRVSYWFCGRVCSQLRLEGVPRHCWAIPLLIDYQEVPCQLNASDMDGLMWKNYQHLSASATTLFRLFTPGRCAHLVACAIFHRLLGVATLAYGIIKIRGVDSSPHRPCRSLTNFIGNTIIGL
jgi:hypothetical protein